MQFLRMRVEKLSNGINCCNNRNDAIYRNFSFNIVAYNIMKEEFYFGKRKTEMESGKNRKINMVQFVICITRNVAVGVNFTLEMQKSAKAIAIIA